MSSGREDTCVSVAAACGDCLLRRGRRRRRPAMAGSRCWAPESEPPIYISLVVYVEVMRDKNESDMYSRINVNT